MTKMLRVVALAAVWLLLPVAARALERSECKQYGGTANCWAPVIGGWTLRAGIAPVFPTPDWKGASRPVRCTNGYCLSEISAVGFVDWHAR